jgi:hypothetical protein
MSMIEHLYDNKPQILRVVLTTVTLILLKYFQSNDSLVLPIASLFILDTVDCYIYRLFDPSYKCGKKDMDYQKSDKIIDLYAYTLFIILFYKQFDKHNLFLYIYFLLSRVVGVYMFYKTENKTYLKVFYDGVNAFLILFELSRHVNFIKTNYKFFLLMTVCFKILFEIIFHKE